MVDNFSLRAFCGLSQLPAFGHSALSYLKYRLGKAILKQIQQLILEGLKKGGL